ncbi:hypothetical protein HXA31_20520 [Salipaludibacillus agaradhaerens]|jgi:hypothetical protein|uniref:Uncharacterized protein n=1 Tax=Salipaludibacillus agaradhaerens TaxID=76935 RepID=A0A9Q4FZJ9_SALAG|nr:hypothetical protein [Salipaludibacillus agaradhaerens]MCR6096873.1 hypothetical protein [Salipaludibacillus agaradhaerens]MCR6116717.1 hypothetical protein [Salipaludibacillus agaradhaerens]
MRHKGDEDMREEFKRLKRWVEECPIEAAMRIEELEGQNKKLNQEIGRYSNKVWELAEEQQKIYLKSRSLIAEMVNGK